MSNVQCLCAYKPDIYIYYCPTFVDLLVHELYVSSAIFDEQRHFNFLVVHSCIGHNK